MANAAVGVLVTETEPEAAVSVASGAGDDAAWCLPTLRLGRGCTLGILLVEVKVISGCLYVIGSDLGGC